MATASKQKPKSSARNAHAAPNRRSDGVSVLKIPALKNEKWLVHGFSTCPGGVSELAAAGASRKSAEKVLNLGFVDWDQPEQVKENRRRFLDALSAQGMSLVTLRQIHSDIVHIVKAHPPEPLQGDAIITATPGLLLAVQTADCVPILLADRERRVVAAIHAGWRGTAKRIAAKTVGRMRLEFGTRPGAIFAALGPSIGHCCYEIGSDVVREFEAQFLKAREWFDGPYDSLACGEDPNPLAWLTMMPPGHQLPAPRALLDLHAANRAILEGSGVTPRNIFASDLCTSCRTDILFSYRREKITGRLMAVIGIRP